MISTPSQPFSPSPLFEPVARVDGDPTCGVLLLCDHASNRLPEAYGKLGLADHEFERHIAYDIGAAWVTRRLAALFGAPALMTCYSRLLIDPNRGEDDPTIVMRLSDGAVVPGNARIDEAERRARIERFHRPYHEAIDRTLEAMIAAGPVPVIVSIHSFTPSWKGVPRPWEVGILWDTDDRLNRPLIAALAADGLTVGDNEPYDGALLNDTLYRHGTQRGIAHTLIEVRQDLIATEAQAVAWADRLHRALAPLIAAPELHTLRSYGSRALKRAYPPGVTP